MAKMGGLIRKFWLYFTAVLLLTAILIKADNNEEDEEDSDDDTPPQEEDGVLVLTNDNFDDVVYSGSIVLVEFYAPWCGHCKQLAPEYAEAAKKLKDNVPPVLLAKVDATVEEDVARRFEVSGYPTLKFFKDGEVHDYDGARSSQGIVDFMATRADPDWKPPPEAVVTLNKDNFAEFIEKEELALVEFYAPWCGHCKKLAPEYEKAAQKLKTYDPPIALAKVDATLEPDIAKQFDVTGYPTLKIFRKGRAQEYTGGRDEHGIVNHMISQQGEASKLKTAVNDLKTSMTNDDITIIAFFDNLEDPLLRVYMDAANDMREDYKFAHTLSPEARKHYKVNPKSVVVFNAERFYTKFEPNLHVLQQDDFTVEDVKDFVEKYRVPLVGHYIYGSEKRYKDLRPLCLVFYTVDWSFDHREATQLWRNKIAAIANEYRDIKFAIADEDDQRHALAEFELDDSGEELNIGCYGSDKKKYRMDPMEEYDADDFKEWLDKFKEGKLTPRIKSQPVPKRQHGSVTVVVGKTFQEIVMDKSKDVLLEMYAPWCGHCKQLEPIYKQLAKKYKDVKNLVIAKFDATANDSPDAYSAEGFPTIYFAPSNSKETPKKFDGGRTLEDFVKYLEENATVSLDKSPKEEL